MLKTKCGDIIGDDRDVLLTRQEAALYLRKSVPTLCRWAAEGYGPRPHKVGPRDIRYTLKSLREMVEVAS